MRQFRLDSMDGYRLVARLLLAAGLLGLSGAGCPQMIRPFQSPPGVLPPAPTLEQVLRVVNANSGQIRSFSTTQATLSGPGIPMLRASVAMERPRRLRLRADTGLTGPELDLGSNDELFWFWVRRSQPPAAYYCRHEQFASCPLRNLIPIEPAWLIEALATSELDPALPHQGPFPLPGQRLEVRTVRETVSGPATKITVVDAVRGLVVEQHIRDAQGRLTASAVIEQHRRDPLTGLVVPRVVKINCPPAQFSMRIDLGNVQVNRLPNHTGELWTMPVFQGSQTIDLCDPNFRPPVGR